MTRALSAENYAALQNRRLVARDFLWFVVRDRDTGAPVYDGEWSDVGTITADVIDPDTGGSSTREFFGSGTLIQISDVPLVSSIVVQNVTITLAQCADRVNELIRAYDCKQARVEIYRGLFDPDSRNFVAPATPRFVGFVDHIEIKTPKEGDAGGVELTCTSYTQEMTRSNPDTRADASQRLRNASDNFYQDVAVVGSWEHFWGKASGKVPTNGAVGSAQGASVASSQGGGGFSS